MNKWINIQLVNYRKNTARVMIYTDQHLRRNHIELFSRKAQSQTRQILCHQKKFYYRTVKSLRTGRTCGKVDAGVFKQFWNLSGLSLGHNQLEIIYVRQKMMLTPRNRIYIETELAKRGGMAGAPDEHAEVSGKSGLELFCPLACSMQIFASYLKIMIIDTTEMLYRTGIRET